MYIFTCFYLVVFFIGIIFSIIGTNERAARSCRGGISTSSVSARLPTLGVRKENLPGVRKQIFPVFAKKIFWVFANNVFRVLAKRIVNKYIFHMEHVYIKIEYIYMIYYNIFHIFIYFVYLSYTRRWHLSS